MKNAIQRGGHFHWTNGGAVAVRSGDLVHVGGALVGVAETHIEPGDDGALDVDGIFWLPADAAEVIALGAVLNLDTATGELSAVNAGVVPSVAMAWRDKEAGTSKVAAQIRAGGFGGAAGAPLPISPRTIVGTPTDNADVLTAFNAANAALPPTSTTTAIYVHKGTDRYLYSGPRGVPAVATAASEFDRLASVGGPTKHAWLVITVDSPAGTVFDITAAGPTYSHAGDADASLGASAAAFADDESINVELNGDDIKPDVAWLSPTTFNLPFARNVDDRLVIESP